MPNERLFVVAFMVQRHVPRSPSQVFVRLLRVFSEQYIEKVHSHQWTRTWAYFVLRSMRYWKIWTDFYWVKVKLTTGTKMRRQTHSNGYEVHIAQSLHKKSEKREEKGHIRLRFYQNICQIQMIYSCTYLPTAIVASMCVYRIFIFLLELIIFCYGIFRAQKSSAHHLWID